MFQNWYDDTVSKVTVTVQYIEGASRGAFQHPVHSKCMVQWLTVLARLLSVVHNDFGLRQQVTSSVNRPQHREYSTLIEKCVESFKSPKRPSRH